MHAIDADPGATQGESRQEEEPYEEALASAAGREHGGQGEGKNAAFHRSGFSRLKV